MVNYGRINDEDKGSIPFYPFPHLIQAIDLFEQNKLSILLKARQVCFTWLVAHYVLSKALFHESFKAFIVSKSEPAANELISYCKFIYNNLPTELKVSMGKDQEGFLTFPALSSQIRALAATETAGIGFGGASLIALDEFAFHPFAKQNYSEIKPMIDAGGNRKLIIGSAPNKLDSESKFNELWYGAKSGNNNFAPVFWAYNVVPYRDEEWYLERAKEYDPLELATRYPKSEQEALSSTKDLCRFDVDSINWMIEEAKRMPILEERYNGIVKIYKRPIAGEKYCFAIDSSEGDYDPSVGLIGDWRTCEEVAEFSGKISVDEQARIIWELYQEYNQPYCAPERNGAGVRLVEKLQGFGVKNFFLTSKDKPGWYTSGGSGGGGNRPVLIGDLAEAIYKKSIRLYNPSLLSEFLSFIRTDRKPEGEATKGSHDDYVMVSGIFLQIRREMPSGGIKISHWQYKD